MRPTQIFSAALAAGLGLLAAADPAFAEDQMNSGDTAWMLTSTALVLMMTIPGVALFYGGLVRKKNVLATVMQSFATACFMTLMWMIVAYSLAFGDGGAVNALVGGLDKLLLNGMSKESLTGTIPESVFMTFQMTFAIITPALICGAVADRMKFSSLLVFLCLWVVLVYAPICHWVWGGGFLSDVGVLDFAGGTVVHISSGVAGLVAAVVLGRRHGYMKVKMAPHNLVYSVLGASLLWVGWFGFNAGSAAAANGAAGMAMAVTQIAAAAAGAAWMISEWIFRGKPSTLGTISGAVAGLVAITPASGFVDPKGALAIGLMAGVVCFFASAYAKRVLGYDDALDVFGIHGVGGIVGAVLTGVFAVEAIGGTKGLIEGNWGQVLIQIEGVLVTIGYCAVMTFIILMFVRLVMGLRVHKDAEIEGLDVHLHGEAVQ
ncbi:MAG: ammonium transporter [Methyloligellaceae bacterium]